jgi:hypothetical protein
MDANTTATPSARTEHLRPLAELLLWLARRRQQEAELEAENQQRQGAEAPPTEQVAGVS